MNSLRSLINSESFLLIIVIEQVEEKAVVVVFLSNNISVKRILKIVLVWVSLASNSNSFSESSVVCLILDPEILASITSWALTVINEGISNTSLILLWLILFWLIKASTIYWIGQ